MKTNRLKPLQKNLATMIKYAPLQYLTRHATNPVCRVKTNPRILDVLRTIYTFTSIQYSFINYVF